MVWFDVFAPPWPWLHSALVSFLTFFRLVGVFLRARVSTTQNIDIPHFTLQPPDGGQELVTAAALRLNSGRRYGLIGRYALRE